jgi:hypothetical protein
MTAVLRWPDRWGPETIAGASAYPEIFDHLDVEDVKELLDELAARLRL